MNAFVVIVILAIICNVNAYITSSKTNYIVNIIITYIDINTNDDYITI